MTAIQIAGSQPPLPNFPDALMRGHATCVTCTWIMPAFDGLVRITMNSSYARLRGEHRAEPVAPEPHRLTTNIDATLGQQVLDNYDVVHTTDSYFAFADTAVRVAGKRHIPLYQVWRNSRTSS